MGNGEQLCFAGRELCCREQLTLVLEKFSGESSGSRTMVTVIQQEHVWPVGLGAQVPGRSSEF